MRVATFLQEHHPHLTVPFDLSQSLGGGSDGEVFSLSDTAAVKLTVLSDWADKGLDLHEEYARIWWVLHQVRDRRPPYLVRVYDLNVLTYGTLMPQDHPYLVYYCRMEKLLPLTEDEQKVFQTILSHEDRHLRHDYNEKELDGVLEGLAKGLDFSIAGVRLLYWQVRSGQFQHLDLHTRNVMKDAGGNFRLVDLDRLKLTMRNNDELEY
jgi:hypothetical protein